MINATLVSDGGTKNSFRSHEKTIQTPSQLEGTFSSIYIGAYTYVDVPDSSTIRAGVTQESVHPDGWRVVGSF